VANDPIKDPADSGQVIARAGDPRRQAIVEHTVFDMASIAHRPRGGFQGPKILLGPGLSHRRLGQQEAADLGTEEVLVGIGAVEVGAELLDGQLEVVATGAEGRLLNEVDHRVEDRRALLLPRSVVPF
jgi:hypothetical protein